jgi:PBP1b-binding outer membrane lipoprotein LpoB
MKNILIITLSIIILVGCGGNSSDQENSTLSKPQTNKIDTPPMPEIGG